VRAEVQSTIRADLPTPLAPVDSGMMTEPLSVITVAAAAMVAERVNVESAYPAEHHIGWYRRMISYADSRPFCSICFI